MDNSKTVTTIQFNDASLLVQKKLKMPLHPITNLASGRENTMLIDEHSRRRLASIRGGERIRQQMIRSGFALNGKKMWTEEEKVLVRATYPDYHAMQKAIPHRSRASLECAAFKLGVTRKKFLWSAEQVSLLRRNYPIASTPQELMERIGRPLRSIREKAETLRLKRGPQPYKATGNKLFDDLREHCRILNFSMADLDQLSGTGRYFHSHHWSAGGRGRAPWFSLEKTARGVLAIGGALKVSWNDKVPDVDKC